MTQNRNQCVHTVEVIRKRVQSSTCVREKVGLSGEGGLYAEKYGIWVVELTLYLFIIYLTVAVTDGVNFY